MAEQRISLITLGTRDLATSKRFYVEGFRWDPVFENEEIVFYQLGGVILGTFADEAFKQDMASDDIRRPGAFALAHNVREQGEVEPLMESLVKAGGRLLRAADEPPIGGLRGYVADPDEHAWEIAWNPGFPIDDDGNVRFGT